MKGNEMNKQEQHSKDLGELEAIIASLRKEANEAHQAYMCCRGELEDSKARELDALSTVRAVLEKTGYGAPE